ncbi:hypothetical protein D0Z07_8359 [Hyphodiscus hymeniophilus]|uniref:Uncharacterized protein n=1 Tax=Hyphodiscus hymeniophilus TaxID=353542 RepID=A0A9P6SLT0_9HELO|nr:hypothetical protein D0Z07_8359 [Hyphodiscus hymeniophilus]
MEQTTARLRKTFHYPAGNDSDDSLPEALDEEEQETLIRTLNQQNTNFNRLYTRILLALPALSIIPYLTTLFSSRTSLLSVLSISSLLSTAFLLYVLPPGRTNIPILDAWNKRKTVHATPHSAFNHDEGPIAEYLPLMNIGLCVVLGLLGMVFRGKEEVWLGFGWLPAVIYGVSLLAKVVMGSVDPEAELGGLRYEFKGA